MTAQPFDRDEVFLAGYLRGVEAGTTSGHAAGYTEGLAVLVDAAGALAQTRPSKAVEWATARSRRDTYATPAKTAAQIRIEAARSWGLTIPADLLDPAGVRVVDDGAGESSAAAPEAVDELSDADADVDDLAWPP